jgi:hypothetical protein
MSTLFHMKLGDGSALFLISSRKRTTSESLLEARFQQIYSAAGGVPSPRDPGRHWLQGLDWIAAGGRSHPRRQGVLDADSRERLKDCNSAE